MRDERLKALLKKQREEADARDRRARWNPWAEDRHFQTGWGKLWFALFGELKILYWIFWGFVLFKVAFWGTVLWVIVHFIRKFW